jgi:hypothetical protein
LPDRTLDFGKQERVSFLIRRLLPAEKPGLGQELPDVDVTNWDEYGMVVSPSGAGWQRIAKNTQALTQVVLPGEERLPLFPVSFGEDDGRKRRLFSGLIPVGKREAYMGASRRFLVGEPKPDSDANVTDPRMLLFWTQVTEPWKRLIEQANTARKIHKGESDLNVPSRDEPLRDDDPKAPNALTNALKVTREQLQTVSWYILLDFANLLEKFAEDVWRVLLGQSPQIPLTTAQNGLITVLVGMGIDNGLATVLRNGVPASVTIPGTLKDALVAVKENEKKLEAVVQSYERKSPDPAPQWPTFLFPLADPDKTAPLPPAKPGEANDPTKLEDQLKRIEYLSELIKSALPALPSQPMPTLPVGIEEPLDPREGWFVIRCVFERPNCGPLEPPIVSEPTRPFQMAGFFDPDAPARPIRIALPVDTSPAGLRKFDKKAAFIISDMLCGQIDRVKQLSLGDLIRSVLPWPLHKDLSVPDKGPCKSAGLEIGMICSLSIPIITICALLLLMIIVSLLDIIFRWIPYFIVCFPLPGFKAKRS